MTAVSTTVKKCLEYNNPTIICHPDNDIDLALFPMNATLSQFKERGKQIVHWSINESMILSPEEWKKLSAVEDLLMVGCPDGLFDLHNNLALMRRGITASHPAYDFNGKPIFISDIACFPGSSGSPVFSYSTSPYIDDESGNLYLNVPQFKLLGIQSEVYEHKKDYYNNLAKVVKSSELTHFRPLLADLYSQL